MTKETPTVPCEFCEAATPMTATKRCDRCFNLERRVVAAANVTVPDGRNLLAIILESATGQKWYIKGETR